MTDAMDPATATSFVHAAVPGVGRMGVVVEAVEPGYVRLRMPIEGNGNHMGTMYAGALFAIAELPGGILPLTVLQNGLVPIVSDMTITFRRAARTDVFLDARIDPDELRSLGDLAIAEGKATFELNLTIVDDAGSAVATTQATYQLRPPKST
ncbi:MAG: YiiD C-terminal domain-containing protein [Candidatus Nanopelagicales bacterium]|nr:YiiD C-terminal domain-containing protein [Candidatus Nanopelagicales bacterium]